MNGVLTTIQHRAARWRERAIARFPWLRHIGWAEVVLAACALVALFIANQFIELADDVQEGDTTRVDRLIIRSLRRADDPGMPVGPAWLRGVALDLTSLGSHAIILLVVIAIGVLLAMKRQWRVFMLVMIASIGAISLSALAKHVIGRDRPDVVPHFVEVSTYSFPSGHATLSAAVYLTLGAILAQVLSGRWTRAYCLALAVVVVFQVGQI